VVGAAAICGCAITSIWCALVTRMKPGLWLVKPPLSEENVMAVPRVPGPR
jgi:hypothetical protein